MNMLASYVALPLGAAFLVSLVRHRRIADTIALVATGTLFLGSLAALGASRIVTDWLGGWNPTTEPIGINLVRDGLTTLILMTIAAVSFAATLYSVSYMERYTAKNKYYALFLLMVAGMNGVALAGDIFNMYVFLEIASIASYALVAFGCGRDELEAAFKYLVLGTIASLLILLAVAVLYAATGTLNIAQLALTAPRDGRLFIFAMALFCAGFGVKAALVPFHAWLPDAHPSAPAPISAMLSGVLIKAVGVYALVRVAHEVLGFGPLLREAFLVLGTVSMAVGALLALGQGDLKRLLAYSSISQIGYVVLGFGLGTPLGLLGGVFHLMNHAASKALLFLNAGAVEYRTGTRQIEEMGGLRSRMPWTAGTSLVSSMSISGVPPFAGFWSKLIIILACVEAGRVGYAAWAVGVGIITLGLYLRVQKSVFYGTLPRRWADLIEVPATMRAAMTLLALACVLMGLLLLPAARSVVLEPAARALAPIVTETPALVAGEGGGS